MAPRKALHVLTVLPVGPARTATSEALRRSRASSPRVVACLGALAALVDLAAQLVPPPTGSAALVLAVLVVPTGGLHLDGLMDRCDDLFVRRTPTERLTIMRDSRAGSHRVGGGLAAPLLQFPYLSRLTGLLRSGGSVAMTTLSRWAMVFATVSFPYARAEGPGAAFTQGGGRRETLNATLLALMITGVAVGQAATRSASSRRLTATPVARATLRKLPGLTGDFYRATNEVVAPVTPLALAIFPRRFQ